MEMIANKVMLFLLRWQSKVTFLEMVNMDHSKKADGLFSLRG